MAVEGYSWAVVETGEAVTAAEAKLLDEGVVWAQKYYVAALAEIGSEGCDAFGEICNMIAGNFKNKISGLGNGCMLSVPAVISGGHYHVHPLSRSEAVEVTLLFEGAPVSISLRLHN